MNNSPYNAAQPSAWRSMHTVLSSRPFMIALSILFTILAVWATVRDLDLRDVGAALAHLPKGPFVWSFLCLVLVTILRAARLHILLRSAGSNYFKALETILIGYFFTTLLPLRAGELVRIGYFSRRAGAPALTVTSAMVVERACDLVALALIASVVLSNLAGREIGNLPVAPWMLGAAAGVAACGALVIGLFLRRRMLSAGRALSGPAARLDEALRGLAALASPAGAALALAVSLAFWMVVAWSIQTALTAADVHVSLADACVVLLGTCFTIALPSTPGFVGTYHLGFVAGALLIGIPREVSLPVAIVLHLVIQVPFLPIGGLVLFTGGRKALAREAGI